MVGWLAGSHQPTGQRLKVSKAGTCDRQSPAFGLFCRHCWIRHNAQYIYTMTSKTFGICNECTVVLTEFSAYFFKMIKPNSAE